MKNLIAKIIDVQAELKAPKGRRNSFGNYNYRSAEDILEAVKPICFSKGLMLSLTDAPEEIGGWHYIKATASITDGEHTWSVTASAREEETKKGMDASQISGTASSYARKYALNGLFCIDDTKDADTDEYRNESDARSARTSVDNKPIGTANKKALMQKASDKGVPIEKVLKAYKKESIDDLTMGEWNSAMNRLDKN